ncbi:MAG: hypothetical protein ABIH92_03300 [Nanoarchaeota archaeon]
MSGHNNRFIIYGQLKLFNLCACGCGQFCKKNIVRNHYSLEMRKIRSDQRKRDWQNPEYAEMIRIKNSKTVKDKWQNDVEYVRKTMEGCGNEVTRKKASNRAKLQWQNQDFRDYMSKAISIANSGRIMTEVARQHMSEAGKGRVSWNIGLTKEIHPSIARQAEKVKITSALLWEDEIYLEHQRIGRNTKPNKSEIRLLELLNTIDPSWRYVGDFKLNVGGKFPDYWNGEKKLIELFGDYWHQNDDPQKRIEFFKEQGYDTLVIWGSEIKYIECIEKRIRMFLLEGE